MASTVGISYASLEISNNLKAKSNHSKINPQIELQERRHEKHRYGSTIARRRFDWREHLRRQKVSGSRSGAREVLFPFENGPPSAATKDPFLLHPFPPK
jgi:hypothetical protein